MRRFAYILLGVLLGCIVGIGSGLVAAGAIPRCGEDCYAAITGLVLGCAAVGALSFGICVAAINRHNWRRRAVWLAVIMLLTTAGASVLERHRYASMHSTE